MDWGVDSLDHKVPLSWFKCSTPPYIVNDLRNLQPLKKSLNSSKKNYFMHPVDVEYYLIIKKWIK